MNKDQASYLKHKTCYLIEILDPHLDDLKEHGMAKKETDLIDKFLNKLNQMNEKYVRLSK